MLLCLLKNTVGKRKLLIIKQIVFPSYFVIICKPLQLKGSQSY